MTDVLFLSKGRPEFTKASWAALQKNTPNARLWVFTDGDESQMLTGCEIIEPFGGPVACMNACLDTMKIAGSHSRFLAKIDNDTIVPPGWLEACLDVMNRHPEVDLLGIEPWTPDTSLFPHWVKPQSGVFPPPFTRLPQSRIAHGEDSQGRPLWRNPAAEGYREFQPRPVSHIGGIGVFRRSAFERFGRPTPNTKDGRYGGTEWMWANPSMVKAFIDPPLPVFLLDHLPFEPWCSLSRKYERAGVQRPATWFYDQYKHRALWEWWLTSGEAESKRGVDVGGSRL